jgi:hypothetical protein
MANGKKSKQHELCFVSSHLKQPFELGLSEGAVRARFLDDGGVRFGMLSVIPPLLSAVAVRAAGTARGA